MAKQKRSVKDVDVARHILGEVLIAEDRKLAAQEHRRRIPVNIYRLSLFLKAANCAEHDVRTGARTWREAMDAHFCGPLVNRFLAKIGEEPIARKRGIVGY